MEESMKPFALLKTAVLVIVVVTMASVAYARPCVSTQGQNPDVNPPRLIPSPATLDQIIQNFGNIATTVDNWGYIGGYGSYGYPSGEWPRGSSHNYLAEVKYWMGAVSATGDTLVADTYEDFQGISDIIAGGATTKIFLSTDTGRYYQYDPSDTVGSSVGSPALGWRVWNGDSAKWVYNQVYDPLDSHLVAGNPSHFYEAGPTSLQESFYRFNDAAQGSSLMGLEMTQTVLQWNYCYNQDFLYVILDITNTSATDYHDFAFGLYIDIDVGANTRAGQNGNLGDLVGSDSAENLAWIYDSSGYDGGWKSTTGLMGTKLIEAPDHIGVTSFRTGDWALVPEDDPGKYDMINGTQFDGTNPPSDQYYVQCTRGIDLLAGKTVRVVYALIAGANETAFRANAAMAQTLYNAHYVGPQPPTAPFLSATAGNGRVYLKWTDTSEVGVDPLTGVNDFRGYKLYRSDNRGKTWGEVNWDNRNDCLTIDYIPLADFKVGAVGEPMTHNYIDAGLSNGVDYWYCLAAYDAGEDGLVDVLQSGFGSPGSARNVAHAMPRTDPAGYVASAATVQHRSLTTQPVSDGEVIPTVFDRDQLTSSDYKVVFTETPEQTYWHLVNVETGDTVLKNQTMENADAGLYQVAEGLRVVVNNGVREPRGYEQTGFATAGDTTMVMGTFVGSSIPYVTGDDSYIFGDSKIRSNYEIRYTGDSTSAVSIWEGFDGVPYDHCWVPFEVWNTTTGQRVSLSITKFPVPAAWAPTNTVIIVDYPYDTSADLTAEAFPYLFSWAFRFDATVWNPQVGDVFTVEGAPVNGPSDEFAFKPDGVNAAQAQFDMKKIHTLPDPYFGRYAAKVEASPGQSVIEFVNLPDKCTIRIYTLAGDLVQTMEHEGFTGTERWNLQSRDQREVASGIYLYHVDSPYGERLGRMAIMK
jgi:hypothetical protein